MATTTYRAVMVTWAAAKSKVVGKSVVGWEVMKAGWAEVVGLAVGAKGVKSS